MNKFRIIFSYNIDEYHIEVLVTLPCNELHVDSDNYNYNLCLSNDNPEVRVECDGAVRIVERIG